GSAGLMAVLYHPGTDPSRVYYGTDTRVGTILLGAALACVWAPWRSTREPTRLGRAVLALTGVLALGALALSVGHLHQFDGALYRGGLLGVAAAATVLVAVLTHHGTPGVHALLGSRPMVWLGRRSYGLYLFHWPVILLTRSYYDVPVYGAALLALRAAVTVVLAAVSYRFVEAPVRAGALGRLWADLRGRASGRRVRRSWVALRIVGLAAAVVAVGTTAVVARTSTTPPALLALQAASPVAPAAPATTEVATSTTSTTAPPTVASTEAPTTVPPATEPLVTTSTVLPTARVTGLGDSVLLEAKATLERRLPDAAVDAVVGRQFKELLAVAQSLRDSGRLGEEVILQMGNNGPVTSSQFDQIMDVLTGARRVVVINVKVPRPWEPTNNAVFADGVGRWPNAVLLDWHRQGAAHPELFADDGTHMGPTGVIIFVELILSDL
ncbi:MAG: acyltransferase, partial [Actinomycetota bacterium]|nr:acyltransferase [Actinomycetota bacterium]